MTPLIVGRIRRPHGVRGSVLIAVETDRPGDVFVAGKSLVVGDSDGEATDRSLVIGRVRTTPDAVIVDFDGLGSRELVDDLRGHTLLIDAADAAPASPDEIHHRVLIGLEARAGDQLLGKVEDIMDLATGKLLIVRSDEGKEWLVPLVPAFIREVDPKAGFVEFDLPDGFLDL